MVYDFEELDEVAGLEVDLFAADIQHLLDARLEQCIGPDFVQGGQCLENMDAGVHRFLSVRGFAVRADVVEVPLVHIVVGVVLEPGKGLLGQFECGQVFGGAVAGGQRVDAEGVAIDLLRVGGGPAVGANRPEEAAALLVPELFSQTSRAAAGHRQVEPGLGREASGGLGAGPGEAALIDDALVATGPARPVQRVVLKEATALLIDGDREPLV